MAIPIRIDRFNATKCPHYQTVYEQAVQSFMQACKDKKVDWAIFSDLYGIWFPKVMHAWYEKSPGRVTKTESKKLVRDFDEKLTPSLNAFFSTFD
jgi:hypothetical protein